MKKIYAVFGGNFNPIHYGHIGIAQKLAKNFLIKKIIFIPNNNPPHRNTTKTSIIDKLKMIKIAIHKNPIFQVSYLESKRTNIFYSIDTLKKIRIEIGYFQPLCFIIGEDNFHNLNFWKDWKNILLISHLLVFPRKCFKKNNIELNNWINSHLITDSNLLYDKPFGYILFFNTSIINITSTQIRNNYYKGKSSHGLLPLNVDKYIIEKKLYFNELIIT